MWFILANEQNLLKGDERHKFTPEEHSKGGKKSAEVRRKKRDLRLALEMLLEKEYIDKNGDTLTGTEAITARLFQEAMKGNIKAFGMIRSTVGQDPVQKIMVSEVSQDVINEVEKAVLEDTEENDTETSA